MEAILNIKVNEVVKIGLDQLKIHPREPYYEVIQRMIECCREYHPEWFKNK